MKSILVFQLLMLSSTTLCQCLFSRQQENKYIPSNEHSPEQGGVKHSNEGAIDLLKVIRYESMTLAIR